MRSSAPFVCVHNAGRSQMAAGWLTQLAGARIAVRSAASEPEQLNPAAFTAMGEVGIHIASAYPEILTSDTVLGCRGTPCPT